MPDVEARYTFHPVGQGLFASGEVCFNWGRPFHWVYDCGSSTKYNPVTRQIENYEWQFNRTGRIDLLAISHFDEDHISGIVDLLNRFEIGTVLLPYLPLYRRLFLGFDAGTDPQEPLMEFYVNPVAYLAQAGDVERFVLVPPSGEKPFEERFTMGSSEERSEGESGISYVQREPSTKDELADEAAFKPHGRVVFLARSSAIAFLNAWEFVPYNDAFQLRKVNRNFVDAVSFHRDALLALKQRSELDIIKSEYDKAFGRSSRNRNEISLFLYAGPAAGFDGSRPRCVNCETMICSGDDQLCYNIEHCDAASVLYSGDGDLKPIKRFVNLKAYIGADRISKLACFQVMHHGSRHNWHSGLARKIKPRTSVFSSDPMDRKYYHPHAEVLRDFHPYGAVQVDSTRGFSMRLSL